MIPSSPPVSCMRVTALSSGQSVPAARFRIRQLLPALAQHGISVREFCPRPGSYDTPPSILAGSGIWPCVKIAAHLPGILHSRYNGVTWLQRTFLSDRITLENWCGAPVLLDVDDAIWLSMHSLASFERFASRCAGIAVGNEYLKDYFCRHNPNVWVIPTAVDTERWSPSPDGHGLHGRFTVGWSGTAGAFGELYSVEKPLGAFLRKHPETRLIVMAERPPSFQMLPSGQVKFMEWSAEKEVETFSAFDVGIMPLPDNAWTRGKCSYKMLLYMSCGVSVIASPVGMNTAVLSESDAGMAASSDDEWLFCLEERFSSWRMGLGRNTAGMDYVSAHFGLEKVSVMLAEVFRTLLSSHF